MQTWGGVPVLGVGAPETVEAVAVYQLPGAEGVDTLPGGDTPGSDIGTHPNDSHRPPGPETGDSVHTGDTGSDMVRVRQGQTCSQDTAEFILRRCTIIGARLAQLGQ